MDLAAVYNRTVAKAEKVAEKFGTPRVYADPEELLQKEKLDFIDIITEVPAHAPLVYLAAKYKVATICQKPMAPDYETAQKMVAACNEAGDSIFCPRKLPLADPGSGAEKGHRPGAYRPAVPGAVSISARARAICLGKPAVTQVVEASDRGRSGQPSARPGPLLFWRGSEYLLPAPAHPRRHRRRRRGLDNAQDGTGHL